MVRHQQQPARVARYNRAVVLDIIRRYGPVSKSDLAQHSGLALSSVLNVLSSLSRHGLISHVGAGPSTGGRPPQLIELNRDAHFAVGVNLRIGTVEAMVVNLVGDILGETVLPLERGTDPESVAQTVAEAVDQVVRLGRVDPARVLGAGVACPAAVRNGQVVVAAPALPEWRDVPLAELLERRLGLPVTLDNDANLAGLAEYRYGVALQLDCAGSLIYVYADRGIGEGIILDGKIYRGADGLAGELGHIVVDVDGPLCPCGRYGCLEMFASVGAIVRRAVTAGKLGNSTMVADRVGGDWDAVSFAAVCEAIEQGDPAATAVLEEAVAYLAVGVGNVLRQFCPHVLVLGGELVERGPEVESRLRAALENRSSLYDDSATRIVRGQLGSRAAPLGAATLVLEGFFGVPEQVMRARQAPPESEPSFDTALLWPERAEEGVLLTRSDVAVTWAGNLQPASARVAAGCPVTVTIEVDAGRAPIEDAGIKALLHWDRVSLFGSNWRSPKNSPMHLAEARGRRATFSVTLGALPPGKYEFAAHVLGANDCWVRPEGPAGANGRIEVLPGRALTDIIQDPEIGNRERRKEEERVPAPSAR